MDTTNGKAALLLVDLQNDFCHPEGTAGKRGKDIHAFHEQMKHMKNLLETARKFKVPVIHVISEHSAWTESPSAIERFGRTNQKRNLSYCEPGSWGAEIHDDFSPLPGEKVVVKNRYSAFVQTNLELLLRSNGIRHLTIIGAYTNVCIDTTARDAFMRDFFVTVPSNCVVSDNEQLHYAALKLLQGTFAKVVHSVEVKKQWKGEK
ncbi:cysteine hydrolase family protein [Oceanobacillus alkalisoli]|uniref:cysteine hydrolase family protein n=1 Tax=Oceanobacillus alkalisoli TaxID=2925113 RepID=UPI001EF0E4E0|nr:isochorismatase family cysteine hydrolase [Oceanobacillus alkalisoli]MCF3944231.1 cysteine hydrolase [Oceanobacillus alkalisoli]MCG5103160.1 cysteine hydrolase [Oceanobacillus alkalisoli]